MFFYKLQKGQIEMDSILTFYMFNTVQCLQQLSYQLDSTRFFLKKRNIV